jgi:hypothetical protein
VLYSLDEFCAVTENEFKAMVTYFGEDPSQTEPEHFFAIIAGFCVSFEVHSLKCLCCLLRSSPQQKAREDLERIRLLAERAKKRAADKQLRMVAFRPHFLPSDLTMKQEQRRAHKPDTQVVEDTLVDNIINSLRDGEVFRRRRQKTRSVTKRGMLFVYWLGLVCDAFHCSFRTLFKAKSYT